MFRSPEGSGGGRRPEITAYQYDAAVWMLQKFKTEPSPVGNFGAYNYHISRKTLPYLERYMLRNATEPQHQPLNPRGGRVVNYLLKALPGDPEHGTERLLLATTLEKDELKAYSLVSYEIGDLGPTLDSSVLLTVEQADNDVESFMAKENDHHGGIIVVKPTLFDHTGEELERFDEIYKDLLSDLLFDEHPRITTS